MLSVAIAGACICILAELIQLTGQAEVETSLKLNMLGFPLLGLGWLGLYFSQGCRDWWSLIGSILHVVGFLILTLLSFQILRLRSALHLYEINAISILGLATLLGGSISFAVGIYRIGFFPRWASFILPGLTMLTLIAIYTGISSMQHVSTIFLAMIVGFLALSAMWDMQLQKYDLE